jgi:hypothetical protein
MNCRESEVLLHLILDREPVGPARVDLDHHLSECAKCRELHLVAQRLGEGLRLFPPLVYPADLFGRLESSLLTHHRRVLRIRRFVGSIAVAASLLVAALSVHFFARPGSQSDNLQPQVASIPRAKSDPPPSLNRSVAEAGNAVVSLTRRAADETLDQGRLLLPVVLPSAAVSQPRVLQPDLSPPSQTLADVKDSMASGLDQVATSARRAVNLFLREIPPLGTARKDG